MTHPELPFEFLFCFFCFSLTMEPACIYLPVLTWRESNIYLFLTCVEQIRHLSVLSCLGQKVYCRPLAATGVDPEKSMLLNKLVRTHEQDC